MSLVEIAVQSIVVLISVLIGFGMGRVESTKGSEDSS